MFKVVENNILSWSFDDRMLLVIPWGKNSVRIRETKEENFIENNWALTEEIKNQFSESKILIDEKRNIGECVDVKNKRILMMNYSLMKT